MAIVSGNVIGNLSGKLGNLSARTVYGRTVLSARPFSFSVSHDPDSVAASQKFAVNANFAKNVLSVPMLKSIWKENKPQDISAFNFIFKENYPFLSVGRPTTQNILTPDGFPIPVTSAEINVDHLSASLTAMNAATFISAEEVDVTFVSKILLYNPMSEDDSPFDIIKLTQDAAGFDFTLPYSLNIPLHASAIANLERYNSSFVYLTVATKDASSDIVQHSNTYSLES